MSTYEYDDFRVTLTPRGDGSYDVRAVGADGEAHTGSFTVPLSERDLEQVVLDLARTHRRTRRSEHDREPVTTATAVRDIGGNGPQRMDAQRLGAALADALLGGEIGRRYDEAVARANAAGRGVRLSLSLASAPELLHLPWEFLYRRPRFLASQRNSPLVRHLDAGSLAPPPSISSTVRMLGVIADPPDLTPLDVESERRRVEQAVTKVAAFGRIELDWLEPATPRTLRQALRDDSYHILHYVGHSDFTADGEGVLFLEGSNGGRAVPLDSTALANLLSDQTHLRLVVLNSCDGARTTLADPYAGVATTLIQLGVPAVVAMQFEITDAAAIVFADELYTNLIGRQAPIDAAVAEARKAIYIEIDKVEWATPVLFVRQPDVELFRFEVPAAPLPPPRPGESDTDDVVEEDALLPVATPPSRPGRRRTWLLVAAAAALLALAGITARATGIVGDDEPPVTSPPGPAVDPQAPRPHTGAAALQISGPDGSSALYIADAPDDGELGRVTQAPGVSDVEPAWDPQTNRLAFTRVSDGVGDIWYVVPSAGDADGGKEPALLVPSAEGESHHSPVWASDGALFYASTPAGCETGDPCQLLRRATFRPSNEGTDFPNSLPSLDVLTPFTDDVVSEGFSDIRAIASDPLESKQVAVVDATGLQLASIGGNVVRLADNNTTQDALFVTEEGHVLVVEAGQDAATTEFRLYHRDGGELDAVSLAQLDVEQEISTAMGRAITGITFVSMTPVPDYPDEVYVTVDERNDERPPALLTLQMTSESDSDGSPMYDIILYDTESLPPLQTLGRLEALVL